MCIRDRSGGDQTDDRLHWSFSTTGEELDAASMFAHFREVMHSRAGIPPGGMTWEEFLRHGQRQRIDVVAPPGASEAAIDALARVEIGVDGETDDCAICQEGVAAGETALRMPCHHQFHEPCIVPWLKMQGTCPVCRASIADTPLAPPGR
eukprot:TRINITY_DN37422_c0_g1_i2.p1 TRINITY_DN37422_c0_g1~~TRINITY_DN37422_c0_g1_i2.p1  ORF type:complete len:150 (+),score=24.03 TRINITY_DN37422_c0_g1_i2:154-603(+)